jgi:outer membrane receptor protein involved in Fe transport
MTRTRPPPLRAVAIAVIVCTAGAAQAQTAVQRVEIVGTTPLNGVGVDRDQVPAAVQTATGADLERSNAADLSSFLARRLGSVHVNETQNNPFQPDVNYRGFTASPLLGTAQGLSVYVDGVRMNQPFGDVVSWDLIPKGAIASITLMPGSNPLFGLNTLGGALAVRTKDGLRDAGTSVQLVAGQNRRAALEFDSGGSVASGLHWFVSGNRFHDGGWRAASPTDVTQLYGKLGLRGSRGADGWLSVSLADNQLVGNGLQEMTLLARDHASIYSKPDETKNRGAQFTLGGTLPLSSALKMSGVAYWRKIRTDTLNGDVNDDTLDQSVYQPSEEEIEALTAAGYTGVPTSGANAANTPFPFWRCIANALLVDQPAEQCTGVINTTRTTQTNHGLSAQLAWTAPLGTRPNLLIVGAGYDGSRVAFRQGSELGSITPDHGVQGVGAFGDGVTGGDADGEPYDTRVELSSRTRTWSVFATDTLTVAARTHLTLSARYDRTTLRSRDAILPGGGPGSLDGDRVFARLNPAAGLTFSPTAGISTYAGFNQGSRAPSAIELGCADPENPCKLPNAFAGDPPLKQVIAQTVEAGVRGAAGDTRWSVGLFRTDNKDDILFVADNAAGFGYFKNFGKTRRQGLEASFSTRLGAATFGVNYTWLAATFRSSEVVDGSANSSNDEAQAGLPGVEGTIEIRPGDRIPGQPRQILKLFGELVLSPVWSVGGDVTAVGGAPARGNENGQHQADGVYYLGPGRSAGYAVLNLNAAFKPTPALKLFVQMNNALDRRYNTAAQLGATAFDGNGNFVARPFPANDAGDRPLRNSTFFAPGAPRTVWLGVNYQFGI